MSREAAADPVPPAIRNGSVGIRDGARPLTLGAVHASGIAARERAHIADRPDVLLTSPLVRARAIVETAAADAMVAVVDHEPTLSRLLARMLGGPRDDDRFASKNGGAALLVPGGPAAARRLRLRMPGGA